jgi:hypothetical protein
MKPAANNVYDVHASHLVGTPHTRTVGIHSLHKETLLISLVNEPNFVKENYTKINR